MTAPKDRAHQAFETATESLDSIDSTSPVEALKREQEIVNEFLAKLADGIADGLTQSDATMLAGALSKEAPNYNKTQVKELLADHIEKRGRDGNDRRFFDEIIEEDLREVVIIRTTDSKQSTIYRWKFDRGDVETRAGDTRPHFQWFNFRDEYFDATGEDAARPRKERRGGEEWREFIVEIISDRKRETTTRGPRTCTVDSLKAFVQRSEAYGDIETAVMYDTLYMPEPPDSADCEEIWIPNADIKRICNDQELQSTRALQVELDARGYTIGRINGVSHQSKVNNEVRTWWILSTDLALPGRYAEVKASAEDAFSTEESLADGGVEQDAGPLGSVGHDPDGDDGGDSA